MLGCGGGAGCELIGLFIYLLVFFGYMGRWIDWCVVTDGDYFDPVPLIRPAENHDHVTASFFRQRVHVGLGDDGVEFAVREVWGAHGG